MDIEQARLEIEELNERLKQWQYEYYVLGQSSVTDNLYDQEFNRLLDLERLYPHLRRADSPTMRVGSDLSADFPEYEHTIRVLSLDKGYTWDEIFAWMKKCQLASARALSFVVEEKIDGVSIVLYYREGILFRALTRGDGYVGNDVTANIKTIGAVPLQLRRPLSGAVRAEIYLERNDFEELNNQLEDAYANPRNLVAGTIRRVKSSEVARVPLKIFAYEGFWERREEPLYNHIEILAELKDLGFRVNPTVGLFGSELSDALKSETFESFPTARIGEPVEIDAFIDTARAQRALLNYEIDGLVVKVNELAIREQLGYTGHHPRWALAYKFDSPQALTTVVGIDVQIGRTGRATPVARVEPVNIGGALVSNITLHNQDYISMLFLAIGDSVTISRRGDVIPALEEVVEKNNLGNSTWHFPSQCPFCQTTFVERGAHTFCPNVDCPEQVRLRIEFFAGKGQMDIKNLGGETIALLIEQQLVHDIADIYTFEIEKLSGMRGFGPKKMALIEAGIAESKSRSFRRVLVALGISEFGKKAVDLLVDSGIRSMDELLAVVDQQDSERLLLIKGFGEKTVAALFGALSDERLRNQIDLLRQANLVMSEAPPDNENEQVQTFSDQIWCVTGSFDHFKPRSLAMQAIEERGGRTSSSVTGKTTHLLAGHSPGSKLDQAQRLGVEIVNEEQFITLLAIKEF